MVYFCTPLTFRDPFPTEILPVIFTFTTNLCPSARSRLEVYSYTQVFFQNLKNLQFFLYNRPGKYEYIRRHQVKDRGRETDNRAKLTQKQRKAWSRVTHRSPETWVLKTMAKRKIAENKNYPKKKSLH